MNTINCCLNLIFLKNVVRPALNTMSMEKRNVLDLAEKLNNSNDVGIGTLVLSTLDNSSNSDGMRHCFGVWEYLLITCPDFNLDLKFDSNKELKSNYKFNYYRQKNHMIVGEDKNRT